MIWERVIWGALFGVAFVVSWLVFGPIWDLPWITWLVP